jgi:hypothetical protein
MVDDLVVYPKSFFWTGNGELEDLTILTPGVTWLGQFEDRLSTDPLPWRMHLFHLGRAFTSGEELTISFSETWFDRDYFFNPITRVRARHSGIEYINIAVRFPASLRTYSATEMRWTMNTGPPRAVRTVDSAIDTWLGTSVRQPSAGITYGWQWKSQLYDGELAPESPSEAETPAIPGQAG